MGGSPSRLEGLVRRYGALIRGAVAKVLGRRDDDLGDEVVQRVAEALWKQLEAERTIEHPASYLYRCAVRETVRLLQRELDRDQVPLDAGGELVASEGRPDAQLAARELAAATQQILDELADDRAAAVRAHLAGFTVEEIMTMHGWPYHKARNLIARGIAELRTRLHARGVA